MKAFLTSGTSILLLMFMNMMTQAQQIPQPSTGMITVEESVRRDCMQRVFYEIFIRSFYDSNGDGIGDLSGITMKLDYLADLGISGIWLTPFNPAPSYHKYDITDYYDVDKQYGTIDDFKTLVSEAHKRNIMVLMDLVVNHTSWQHPWFQKSLQHDPVYRNYYRWELNPDPSDHNWYLPRDGSGREIEGEKYYGFFWRGMPDLNHDNPEVREAIIDIGKWWLNNTGIDGFRLDAAQHIYDAEDTASNNDWWLQFTSAMKQVKRNVITIGEVWNKKEWVAAYLKSLTGCFNFELSWDILRSLKDDKNDSLIEKFIETQQLYSKQTSSYIDPIFLSNHDSNRILSDLNNNVEKAKVAAAIYLTLPGTPFIYYGEELGMRGIKPDSLIREPFPWDEKGKDKGQTYWENIVYNLPQSVLPLQQQMKDHASMYTFYKTLVELRKNKSALTSSDISAVASSQPELIIYSRGNGDNQLMVLHNLSAKPTTYTITADHSGFKKILFQSNKKVSLKKSILSIAPYSSVILSVK